MTLYELNERIKQALDSFKLDQNEMKKVTVQASLHRIVLFHGRHNVVIDTKEQEG